MAASVLLLDLFKAERPIGRVTVASVSGRPERNMHMGLVYEDAGTLRR